MSTRPPPSAAPRLKGIADTDTVHKADDKKRVDVTPILEASGASYESVPSLLLSEGVMSPVEGEGEIDQDDPGAKIGLASFKDCGKLESLSEIQSLDSAGINNIRASEGSIDKSVSQGTSSMESWCEEGVDEIDPSWLTAVSQLEIDDSTTMKDTRGDENEVVTFDNSARFITRSRTVSETSVGSLRIKSGTCIDPFPSPTSTPRTSISGIPAPPLLSPDLFAPSLESCEDEYNSHSLEGQNHNRHTHASEYSSRRKRIDFNQSPSRCRSNEETPPFTPQSPYLPQPMTQYSVSTISTRSHQTGASAQSPLLKSDNHRIWKDPFPTPDVSLHGQLSTLRVEEIADYCNDPQISGPNDENICPMELNQLFSPPPLPLKEELEIVQVTENFIIQPSRVAGGRRLSQQKSRSSKDIVGIAEETHCGSGFFKVRRISSEASLMLPLENSDDNASRRGSGLPLRKRTSIDDFWKAFRTGPDGNDLEVEDVLETKNKKNTGGKKLAGNGIYKQISRHKSFIDRGHSEDSDLKARQRWGKSLTLEDIGDHYHEKVDVASFWQCSNLGPVRNASKDSKSIDDPDADTEWLGLRKRPTKSSSNPAADSLTSLSKQILPMTPTRKSIQSWTSLQSPVVGQVRESAEELVFSPVRSLIAANSERAVKMVHHNSKRAVKLVQNTQRRLKERGKLRRQRRLARMKEPPPSWWIVIPADHPYKIAWDVMTMIWALMGAYRTHTRIRDRVFDQSPLILLTEIWFTLDILLNFVTEHKTSKGQVIRDGKTVWARYLTTWFVFDLLSLIPWERIYVRPVVEKIKKRNIFQKTFFRSKAVVRVSRVLRGRHIKLFGRVSKQTGTPLRRLVNLSIKYVPKYLLFYRNMRGALAVRTMRLIHWLHNLYKGFWVKAKRRMNRRGKRLGKDMIIFRNDINDCGEDDDEEEDEDVDDDDDGEDVDDENEEDDNDDGYDSEIVDDSSMVDFTDYESPQHRNLRNIPDDKGYNTCGGTAQHESDLSSRRRTFSEY